MMIAYLWDLIFFGLNEKDPHKLARNKFLYIAGFIIAPGGLLFICSMLLLLLSSP